jgi:hypothetical protein
LGLKLFLRQSHGREMKEIKEIVETLNAAIEDEGKKL